MFMQKGDSGGPLFQFNENKRAVLLGVCSHLVYTNKNDTWDVFADIRTEVKWLCDKTGLLLCSRHYANFPLYSGNTNSLMRFVDRKYH
ncbi:hypothetical protein OESDEN_20943 [Oesophagostomum dentatum]|uniref:Peptidase S1 domain-containing protein n=1 Tax=Oesophagostomum dentatum TaxID=61180 RepID=A0A0B1S689_OESDE|nr:hypothetical protein OESDEN_20943 [Oesophagostomum dentatum]